MFVTFIVKKYYTGCADNGISGVLRINHALLFFSNNTQSLVLFRCDNRGLVDILSVRERLKTDKKTIAF